MGGQSTVGEAGRTRPGPESDRTDLPLAMTQTATRVESALDLLLPRPHGQHARVHEAMRYAALAGGKRLRPFLVLASAKLFGIEPARAMRTAAAIELLHTYSLVHDDLPCMDDDDLRRGRPTAHKAFDEATAVLAGDGLLTVAFQILAEPQTHPLAEVRCELVRRLAEAAGSNGMIGGQMIDMAAMDQALTADSIMLLQRLKTGALFEFSCEAGAILGQAPTEHRQRLRNYARHLGLAFQIADDLLDVLGTVKETGKAVGKDAGQGKATLVSIFGVAGAKAEAARLAEEAASTLASFGPDAALLRELPFFLLDRKS